MCIIIQVYYRDAVGAFVAFDVARAATFEAVEKWKHDLDDKLFLPSGLPIPAILLANKVGWVGKVLEFFAWVKVKSNTLIFT